MLVAGLPRAVLVRWAPSTSLRSLRELGLGGAQGSYRPILDGRTDALSATVLVAGLAPPGPGALASTLRVWAGTGQATVVTLAQLRGAAELATGPVVHVVENPSVLAMAVRRFGAACPSLVCPSGWPSTAASLLLRALRGAGGELRYHGDLDGEGGAVADVRRGLRRCGR